MMHLRKPVLALALIAPLACSPAPSPEDVGQSPGSSRTPPARTPERPSVDAAATRLVGAALDKQHALGVTPSDLRTKPNPKGDGTFVYVPRTDYAGVTRNLVWVVVDGRAYPLNGPSKTATPSLPFPREADDATWARTGLNKYSATEAIALLWGSP